MIKLSDLARLESRYKEYTSHTECVVKMIKKCDKNSDGDLDISEIQDLLVVSICVLSK